MSDNKIKQTLMQAFMWLARGADTPQPSELTDTQMKELFPGAGWGIIYYNFETSSWNRNNYMGYLINNQSADTAYACDFADAWARRAKFAINRPAAMVVMAIDDADYRGDMRLHRAVRPSATGRAVVMSLVMRELKNGNLSFNNYWIGAGKYNNPSNAMTVGPMNAAYLAAWKVPFCNALIDTFAARAR